MSDQELINDLQAAITRRMGFETPEETLDFLGMVRIKAVIDLRRAGCISDDQTAMKRLVEIHEAVERVRDMVRYSYINFKTAA